MLLRSRGCKLSCIVIGLVVITLLFVGYLRRHVVFPVLARRDTMVFAQEPKVAPVSSKLDAPRRSFILDSSGIYRIFPAVFRAPLVPLNVLSLVTHCSWRHLHHLLPLIKRWKAPVSVAVFVLPANIEKALLIIEEMRRCDQLFEQFVTVHLVSPVIKALPEVEKLVAPTVPINCSESIRTAFGKISNAVVDESRNYASGTPYPNNFLRNVGRRFSESLYVFVIDVDMMPAKNLHPQFLRFLNNRNASFLQSPEKEVFIVPAFELDQSVASVPEDKSQLLKEFNQLKARPFYFEMCWKCHKPTNYGAWEKSVATWDSSGLDVLEVAYEVLWKDPWEPFFISSNKVPFFDERFKQYGFNRISQACELHVAGYKFSVLNSVFLVHLGFKTTQSFHRTKEDELNRNRRLFATFKQDLMEKYPDSSRKCC